MKDTKLHPTQAIAEKAMEGKPLPLDFLVTLLLPAPKVRVESGHVSLLLPVVNSTPIGDYWVILMDKEPNDSSHDEVKDEYKYVVSVEILHKMNVCIDTLLKSGVGEVISDCYLWESDHNAFIEATTPPSDLINAN